ncbi:MAG: hypothetical protein F4X40_08740 [Chloroflexi bacterium]|nr:hypothetical protein [Chloroflexota bacterium]
MITDGEKIEAHGEFWLPDRPNNKTSGTLHINPDGTAELKLSDVVSGDTNHEHHQSSFSTPMGTPVPTTRIVGVADDIGAVTLEHCFANPEIERFGGILSTNPTRYQVGYVLTGALWEKDEDVEFEAVSFVVEGLNEWVGKSGFVSSRSTDKSEYEIGFTPPPNIEVGRWDNGGLELSIRHTWRIPHPGPRTSSITAEQQTHFYLSSTEPRSIDYFYDVASRLRNFVSLGVGKALQITSMTGYWDAPKHWDGPDKRVETRVHFKDGRQRGDDTLPHHSQMLFDFDATQSQDGPKFIDWLETTGLHREPIEDYFDEVFGQDVTWDRKFRSMFRVVETLFDNIAEASNEMAMPVCEFERIKNKVEVALEDEPERDRVLSLIANLKSFSNNEKVRRVLAENLGIHVGAPVIRRASPSMTKTRAILAHEAGSGRFETYSKEHGHIKVDVLNSVIQIWLLRMAGANRDRAIDMIQNRRREMFEGVGIVGMIKAKDLSDQETSDEVWWKQ